MEDEGRENDGENKTRVGDNVSAVSEGLLCVRGRRRREVEVERRDVGVCVSKKFRTTQKPAHGSPQLSGEAKDTQIGNSDHVQGGGSPLQRQGLQGFSVCVCLCVGLRVCVWGWGGCCGCGCFRPNDD